MYVALTALACGVAVALLLSAPAGLVLMGAAAVYAWLPGGDEDE